MNNQGNNELVGLKFETRLEEIKMRIRNDLLPRVNITIVQTSFLPFTRTLLYYSLSLLSFLLSNRMIHEFIAGTVGGIAQVVVGEFLISLSAKDQGHAITYKDIPWIPSKSACRRQA